MWCLDHCAFPHAAFLVHVPLNGLKLILAIIHTLPKVTNQYFDCSTMKYKKGLN